MQPAFSYAEREKSHIAISMYDAVQYLSLKEEKKSHGDGKHISPTQAAICV